MAVPKTKRASYRKGVEWIALNDEPDTMDVDEIAGFISTALLADLFGKDEHEVAKAVARWRERNGTAEVAAWA